MPSRALLQRWPSHRVVGGRYSESQLRVHLVGGKERRIVKAIETPLEKGIEASGLHGATARGRPAQARRLVRWEHHHTSVKAELIRGVLIGVRVSRGQCHVSGQKVFGHLSKSGLGGAYPLGSGSVASINMASQTSSLSKPRAHSATPPSPALTARSMRARMPCAST